MRVSWLTALLLLNGCATTRPPDMGSRPLVSPAALQTDRSANQIVRGAFGAREMTFNCVVTVRGDALTVIGLTAMGVRAFTLRYDGLHIQVDNDLPVPPQLTPERLLADIQLVLWPLNALQPALARGGWQLSEISGTRRLRRGDTLIAEVHYGSTDPWAGRSWLVNLEHSYTLGIDSTTLTGP